MASVDNTASIDGGVAGGWDSLVGIEKFLWISLLLFIPISSSPLLPLGAGTLVRPLALIPMALLLGVGFIRIVFLGQRPNFFGDRGCFILLLVFAIYILISGLAYVAFLPDQSFKGQTPLDSLLRAVATLAIGLGFYVVARLNIRTAADALLVEKCLFIGMCASILFAMLQTFAMIAQGETLRTVQAITDIFAVRTSGLANRAQGMTFEPSWFATQLTLLLLPWLVARTISRQSFVGMPVQKRISALASAGFAFMLIGLLCSGSRIGIASTFIILVLCGVRAIWHGRGVAILVFSSIIGAGVAGTVILQDFRAGAGTGYVLGAVPVLTQISPADLNNPSQVTAVTDLMNIAGRVAASQAAAEMWFDHPLWGVSFGNGYRYFSAYVPDWSLATQLFEVGNNEGAAWLDPNAPEKGNAKNLVLRLMAETGVVGFALFGVFFLRHIRYSRTGDKYYDIFRLAGGAAVVFSWLNTDTFADPAMWLVLAVLHTAGRLRGQTTP